MDCSVLLARKAPADPPAHQHRHGRERQDRSRCHCVGFGEGERREQLALLPLEREHGHERQCDDEQAEEQRRADLDRGLSDDTPARASRKALVGMLVRPSLDPLMRSEEHTSELQSLMRISYAVFCLKKKKSTLTA